jgi:hypothetical protein
MGYVLGVVASGVCGCTIAGTGAWWNVQNRELGGGGQDCHHLIRRLEQS